MAKQSEPDRSVGMIRITALMAGATIKRLVVKELARARKEFPKMIFGIRDNIPRATDIADGMLSSVDVTLRAYDREMPGIVLWTDDRFWTEASIVVLTPKGIFLCPYVMSKSSSGNICQSRPDWTNRKESPDLWVKYGEQAILELRKLRSK
ncbi:MAG: hypothetical protein G01um101419_263 [Parcubacteria group bacterium Gr01-1014_19]|nr:MAG: hypothetical protein G01um101419_263 [Parcubacteria group bacterium Gr01-1014_19]